MKALAETSAQVKSQLMAENPLFSGYDNPMGDPTHDAYDDDDDVMENSDIDAMQYMVQRDSETPGGGLFSAEGKHKTGDSLGDNNINQWDKV
jgi:hypothetical protein